MPSLLIAALAADILLTGGRVLDGAGNPWIHADVAIREDRIVFIGDARAAGVEARETIDVGGLLVAPGLWDVHSHADLETTEGRRALSLLYQGVTTVVLGIDGQGTNQIESVFADYERNGIAVNALRYVGHGPARAAAMGSSIDRAASPDEIRAMKAYVERGMEQGAIGFSTGLAYNPGFYATTEEVVELNRMAARYGGVYDTHDRDMGASYRGVGFVASIEEAIAIAERGGTRLIFSHLGGLGTEAHRKLDEMVARIESARDRGVNVMAASTSIPRPPRASSPTLCRDGSQAPSAGTWRAPRAGAVSSARSLKSSRCAAERRRSSSPTDRRSSAAVRSPRSPSDGTFPFPRRCGE
jgi:N-acyl-D-amino-acid deacylase